MALQSWAASGLQRNSPSLRAPETQLAIPILDSVIQGSTAPDEAADSIAAIYHDRILLKEDRSSPQGLWRIICAAVDHCGTDNDVLTRLIQLIHSLSRIDVTDASGCSVQSNMNKDTFWKQLPGFALAYYEELLLSRFISEYFSSRDCSMQELIKPRCLMFQIFRICATTPSSKQRNVVSRTLPHIRCDGLQRLDVMVRIESGSRQ